VTNVRNTVHPVVTIAPEPLYFSGFAGGSVWNTVFISVDVASVRQTACLAGCGGLVRRIGWVFHKLFTGALGVPAARARRLGAMHRSAKKNCRTTRNFIFVPRDFFLAAPRVQENTGFAERCVVHDLVK